MTSTSFSTLLAIHQMLQSELSPTWLYLEDESAKHRGHPGAAGGGGHFFVQVRTASWASCSRLERHRCVYAILAPLFTEQRIHALRLDVS